MTTFAQLGVPRDLTQILARSGITTPFPVQEATLADGLAGRDLCGRAPTGSGKTLAFAIPLVIRAAKCGPCRPSALVLVPTRELAAQVADVVRPLAEARERSVATFYGGTSIARDQRRLHHGVDIAIACPGRLADLVRRKDVHLDHVRTVVIDEADRMADMGFLPEVKWLLDRTARDRQTLLFSATLDGDVDVLIRRYQREPVRYELSTESEQRGDVRHFFWRAAESERTEIARDIVRTLAPAIVFTRTKHGADRLAKQLNRKGVRAAAIHSNRSQSQRERALSDLTEGRVTALVATDVAARGLHVDNVGVVLHFDPPATGKDYVHRSGRTGRAGADGVVVTLVPPHRSADVTGIQRTLAMREHIDIADLRCLRDPSAGHRERVSAHRSTPEQRDRIGRSTPRGDERGRPRHSRQRPSGRNRRSRVRG
jgi:superfamily II DNA/RNA helicase